MNRNKKHLKAAIAVGVCTVLAAGTAIPASAADALITKDENVYATLEQDGSVTGIYVVNQFSSEDGGEISDYGDYTSVKNLTDESEIIVEDGHVTANMAKGKFYYQGELDGAELPWDITIRYFLDDEELTADELAGKSGDLKIVIHTQQNPDSKEEFFERYLLQATVVLNTETCTDIQAEGATAGNVGVNRQLVYTILPGEETEIEITAQVQEFEMDGITFQGVPLALGISEGMLDELNLSDQTKELIDAVALLDDGVGALKEGTAAAADGGNQLADGIGQLADGTGALNSGGSALKQGTSALLDGAKALQGGVGLYTEGVDVFAAGVEQYVAGVEMLAQGSRQLEPLENLQLLDTAIVQMYQAVAVGDEQNGIPSLRAGAEGLSDGLDAILTQVKLLENSTDAEELQELLETVTQLQSLTAQLAETLEEIGTAVGGSADKIAGIAASHQAVLNEINAQIGTANSSISASVGSVNAQIDAAISAVQAAVLAGTLDAATAEQTIAGLNAARISETAVSNIQMPQENAEIQETISSLNGVSETLNSSAKNFQEASRQMGLAADGLGAGLGTAGDGSAITQLSQALSAACEGADQLETGVAGIGDALGQLKESTSFFGQAGEGIAALNSGFDVLTANNDLLVSSSEAIVSAKGELNAGMAALTSGTEELNSGAGTLVNGIAVLYKGVSLLNDNTGILTDGLAELDEGTGMLKEGTQEFRKQTDNIDETIREKMEEMLAELSGDDFEPVSFVSEENTNIGLVQFAITADGIKIPEEIEEAEPEKEEGFLDRLLQLF